jgi:DNA-binding HxlR family transcriptional regulator
VENTNKGQRNRLSMLEMAGILVKEEHHESKAKIFYRLSAQGIDLILVLVEIILWSDKYLSISPQAKQLRKDKETIVKQISSGLKKR